MKRIAFLFGIIILASFLVGCSCQHEWIDATCTSPVKCTNCGETAGNPLQHVWEDATCITPKTCTVCEVTEGEPLNHTWEDATCTIPKTCTVCEVTEGEPLNHTWKDATCTTPKTCSVCNAVEGNVADHVWNKAECILCEITKAEFFLGDDNAFIELYNYIPESGDDYQLYLEDMVLKLCDAITSGRLGSREAQTVIHGLIPNNIYADQLTNDKKMDAIYNYFVFEKLVNYFTLWFDDDGNAYKCEIKVEGVKNYVNEGIACGVFTGNWDSFSLDPAVQSFDSFCKIMNVTPEVAVGFFAIIETYNINWLGEGSYGMLNELN